ncbi:MAG: hypothetical protein STHCBS139747_003186 [Sporothrix thermara]
MATKRGKTAATDELDSLFEGIGDDKAVSSTPKKTATKTGSKAGSGKPKTSAAASAAEKDILAELENELGEQVSRPHTPRASAAKGSSPALGSAALPRRSVESAKAFSSARNSTDERAPSVPAVIEAAPAAAAAAETSAPPPPSSSSGGGGWWGGILSAATSTATAAMKQAEAAVKEIQQNEEAKKWADQVRGNYTSLRGFVGDELRQRQRALLLPTFSDILHTLAPPIASHERLLIHITHDMVGYPSLDPLVYEVFSRVMAQVEGGDLLVVQRGQEAPPGHGDSGNYGSDSAGWRDGPWWRDVGQPRDLGTVAGLREGTKLCRASAEAYANEYYAAHYGMDPDPDSNETQTEKQSRASSSKRGLEVARQRAHEPMSEDNPVRRSDLFLAVQALSIAGGSDDDDDDDDNDDDKKEEDDMVSFAVHILDPVHEIVYHTTSQAFPAKWVRWLDARPAAKKTLTPVTSGGEDDSDDSSDEESDDEAKAQKAQKKATHGDANDNDDGLPDDIRAIVDSGGVDPREWVAEWIEEALSLAVGVVAQRYVAHRMGVGAGSIGRGKRPVDEVLADGAGEAARAGIL